MADIELEPAEEPEPRPRLPWFVKVSPEFYDDLHDTGYGWEGWAVGEDDAIRQALEQCHIDNDRYEESHDEDVDPDLAKVHVAEIDFRRFAGPLVHWARAMGGWEAPVWDALEAAVAAADVPVVPLDEAMVQPMERPAPELGQPFLFDVKLFAVVQVFAAVEAAARRMVVDALDGAQLRGGLWPNGRPVLMDAGMDGEPDLIEVEEPA